MQLVDNNTFLTQLTALFESAEQHGSIWLTHKRLTHDGEDVKTENEEPQSDTQEYQCLIRATNGKNINFSTTINPDQLSRFYSTYGTLLKSSLTATLRKRDKKREKTRAERAAKRKKRILEPVIVDGPKRGAGRRKRQRKIRALMKQQESQRKFKEREERAKAKKRETGV